MVLRADVLAAAVAGAGGAGPVLALSPRGAPLTQARVRTLAAGPGVTLICGRFEGFDERLFTGSSSASSRSASATMSCRAANRPRWSCSMLASGCFPV